MGLWVILLMKCSTFTFLSDVGHITHTCTHQEQTCINLWLDPNKYVACCCLKHFYHISWIRLRF